MKSKMDIYDILYLCRTLRRCELHWLKSDAFELITWRCELHSFKSDAFELKTWRCNSLFLKKCSVKGSTPRVLNLLQLFQILETPNLENKSEQGVNP